MAISLEKGQRIEIGLSKVSVGLGWDPNEGTGFDFDLDASAFMLGSNKKLPKDEYFVFYNNQKSPDGAVESTGDDLTGGNSDINKCYISPITAWKIGIGEKSKALEFYVPDGWSFD